MARKAKRSLKLLVSNKTALLSKYGESGVAKILAAVHLLAAADRRRGIETKLIFLDDRAALKKFAVTDTRSGQQHKEAVDVLYHRHKPHYIVLLDSPDVVPHVSLKNPLPEDNETDLPSDLPYASDAKFGRDATRYLTVTRVVGRIPGVPNAEKPTFLTQQLKNAARFQSRNRKDYLSYFAVTAGIWRGSSSENVRTIFGAEGLRVSPPLKMPKGRRYMRALTHFINCHGGHEDQFFYGEGGRGQLEAMSNHDVLKSARPGTVVAAECCFGAELYDPRNDEVDKNDYPISLAYFDRGAIGFLGSTTTAYGSPDSVTNADVLTQYFLVNVLAGASLGRALLQARQQFVQTERLDQKENIKTLGQFILLGDPSVRPCIGAADDRPRHKAAFFEAIARENRRVEMIALGKAAGASSLQPGKSIKRPHAAALRDVKSLARQYRMKTHAIHAHESAGGRLFEGAQPTDHVLTIVETKPPGKNGRPQRRVLVARATSDGVYEHSVSVSR